MKRKSALSRYFSRLGRKGAAALNSSLTPKQRSAAARKAINARWAKVKAKGKGKKAAAAK